MGRREILLCGKEEEEIETRLGWREHFWLSLPPFAIWLFPSYILPGEIWTSLVCFFVCLAFIFDVILLVNYLLKANSSHAFEDTRKTSPEEPLGIMTQVCPSFGPHPALSSFQLAKFYLSVQTQAWPSLDINQTSSETLVSSKVKVIQTWHL